MNAAFTTHNTPKTNAPGWSNILATLVVGLLSPQNLRHDDDTLAVCRFDAQ